MADDCVREQPTSTDRSADRVVDASEAGAVSRFHTAHAAFGSSLTRPVDPPPDVLSAIAGKSEECAAEQLQQQAAELTHHLHARERELAHWEATLNARSAAHDDQVRSARLAWQEQQLELVGREADLDRRQHLLEQQATELEQRQANWDEQRREQQQTWERHEQRLRAEQATTESLNEQLRRRIEEYRLVAEQQEQCRTWRAELERLHAMLQDREMRLADERRAWDLEKERQQQRTVQQRLAIARHWRFRGQTLHIQQHLLRQRREQLDRRQQALEQLQAELLHARRELLELRLAVELARHGLSTRVPPKELAAIQCRIREFIAEELAVLESTRQQHRLELQTLATSLTQQQESLSARHEAVQRWVQDRQQEFDTQNAELDQRERELEQLYERWTRDKQTWLALLDEETAQITQRKAS